MSEGRNRGCLHFRKRGHDIFWRWRTGKVDHRHETSHNRNISGDIDLIKKQILFQIKDKIQVTKAVTGQWPICVNYWTITCHLNKTNSYYHQGVINVSNFILINCNCNNNYDNSNNNNNFIIQEARFFISVPDERPYGFRHFKSFECLQKMLHSFFIWYLTGQ